MQRKSPVQVYGIGHALVDMQAPIGFELLSQLQFPAGSSELISPAAQVEIVRQLKEQQIALTHSAGGSIANSLASIGALGDRTLFCSRIGDDDAGRLFRDDFANVGVHLGNPLIVGADTGKVLVLISPDGERTMRTCLGISRELSLADVELKNAEISACTFLEGYLVANGPESFHALQAAAQKARSHGRHVALTLGSASLVEQFREQFQQLLPYVTLLLANEKEACALVQRATVFEALEILSTKVPCAVVTCGAAGAYVTDQTRIVHAPAFSADVIDTTGAGDAFAAGFLYGVVNNRGLERSAEFGNFLAGKAVQISGARLGKADFDAFAARYA